MRNKIFLAFLAIVLLWGGGQGVYTSVTNLKPAEYTVSDYIETKPNSKWLRLSGATLDMSAVTYASFLGVGEIKEVYVPVIPTGQAPSKEIHILLATKDPMLLEIASKIRNLSSEEQVKQFAISHPAELYVTRDFEGLIRFGLEYKEDDERALKRENKNLTEDFVVVDEGLHPDYATTGLLFVCGIALATWLIMGLRHPRKTAYRSIPPPLPGTENSSSSVKPPPLPAVRKN
jgi:hypothetical protein